MMKNYLCLTLMLWNVGGFANVICKGWALESENGYTTTCFDGTKEKTLVTFPFSPGSRADEIHYLQSMQAQGYTLIAVDAGQGGWITREFYFKAP